MVSAEPASAFRSPTNPVTVELNWPSGYGKLRAVDDFFACEITATCTAAQKTAIATARRGLSILPKLRALGTIALYATAFEVGWSIGRTIDTKWLHLDGDIGVEDATWTTETWTFVTQSANRDESGWILNIAGPGLSNRVVSQTGAGGIACTSGTCPGGSSATHNLYRTEYLRQTTLSPGVWQDYRASTNQPTYNCQSGDSVGGCYEVFMPEATMEATVGANGTPEDYVAQTTANGNVGSNISTPSATPTTWGSAPAVAAIAALTSDEATAMAAAATPAEEDTAAHQSGVTFDPDWDGYEGGNITMPDCVGLTVAECNSALEAAGHLGTVTELELDIATADVTRPAGAVVSTSVGATVGFPSTDDIELTVNPAVMPLLLPQPLLGETVTAYRARLTALGHLGTITEVELTEFASDPQLGPSAPVTISVPEIATQVPFIVRVGAPWPTPDPRVMPDTDLTITVNAPTLAPLGSPAPGTPATGPPSVVDFSPITDIDWGCKFPFGFICYAVDITDWFNVGPDAPRFAFDSICVDSPGGEVCAGVDGGTFVVDLEVMDDYMDMLRTLMAVALWIGTVYWLAVHLLGFRGGGDPGEAVDEGLDWQ